MKTVASVLMPDAKHARTAFSLLIGSMAFPFVAAIAVAVVWSPGDLLAGPSNGALWILVAASGYSISLFALHKLSGNENHRRALLWFVSLIATFAIVAAFVVPLGPLVGGILAALELVSAAYQVYGILVLLIPDEPPNTSLERTRER